MTTNSKAKQYFKDCFKKELMIRKGIIAAAACVLVLIFSLSFYFWLKDKSGTPFGTNGFWYIKITWNKGIAFGGLQNNLAGILAIQTLVFLLLVAIYLFLAKDIVSTCFIACAVFGGLFNLIQRCATPNLGVLDYFRFGFWPNFAIFNWPDMFVVIGVFGFVISYIVYLVKQEDKEFEEKQKQEEQKQNETR